MQARPSVARADLLAAGSRVGRYELLRRLAIGGMAELHLACATGVAGFQKVVVLKRVLPHLAADRDFVRMFLDEARLAAHLDHPNVVQVQDSGETGGEYYYAMEYVHGRNARELLGAASHAGGMPLEVALTIAIGVASALDHAHRRVDLEGRPLELVHRDVSPSNVLVSYDGAVKLTDFGIAKAATRNHETMAGTMKGKIGYMSPEQCRGEEVDRRSDIFSLGVVLFELTTCERLFYADNDFAVLNRVVSGVFDRPSHRVPGYPPELEAIVVRALATDREQRYESADALRRALEGFAHDRRLRLGAEPVAAWLRSMFGAPPYPRVEVREPVEHAGDQAPTLVLVDDEPTVARLAPAVDEGIDTVASRVMVPLASPRRASRGWIAAAGAMLVAASVGAWWLAPPASTALAPAPASSDLPAPTIAPEPSPGPAATASTRIPEAVVASPTIDAPPTPVAATPPPEAVTTTAPPRTGSRGRGRGRTPGSAAARRPAADTPRNLDALYPDG